MRKSIYVSKGEMSSSLMNYKGEEKQISESLYRNLHVMQRFHEPTKDFLGIFEPHMFVKSNPIAFRHVIHYIFNCLDAEEFKKRFRWPVLDSNGDMNFRESTVNYMNHLNVTHNLGLGTLKKSNICIPGGLKFIKIIHKFSSFLMKQEIGKAGSIPNLNEIPDPNEQLAKLEEFVQQGLDFATMLETRSDILEKRIDEMNGMMMSFFGIKEKGKCWTCLAKEWQDELDSAVENQVKPYLERVFAFNSLNGELNKLLEKLFVDRKENVIQFDKEKLADTQSFLNQIKPNLEQVVGGIVKKNYIDFDNLLQVFAEMLPSIIHKIEIFNFRTNEALEFEYNDMEILDTKALKLQNGMNDVETSLEPFLKKDEEKFKEFCMNNPAVPSTLMYTPPINRQINQNRIKNRLPMMNNGLSQMNSFKKPLHLPVKIGGAVNTSKIPDGRSLLVPSSLNRLSSLDSSLAIISRKPRSNVSTLGNSSTPKPAINRTVNRTRAMSSNLVATSTATATTPTNTVDRFRQSNLQGIMRSPSHRFQVPDSRDDDVFTEAPQ